MNCIIYKLINKVNGKIYIGQTWQSLKERWQLGKGYVKCTYLNFAIKKYGKDNFYYEILDVVDSQILADELESFYIKKFDSNNGNIGYNLRTGGSRGLHSEESKRKVSESLMGHIVTEETKQKQSQAKIGYIPWNKDTIGVMQPNSTSFKSGERVSIATEFKPGMKPWNTGKSMSVAYRQKKKSLTDEQEQYIRQAISSKIKTQAELAKEYNVSPSLISNIKYGINRLE
jgi:group I intron endonuclease